MMSWTSACDTSGWERRLHAETMVHPPGRAQDGRYGPGGAGTGAGENASLTSRMTFARVPSATG